MSLYRQNHLHQEQISKQILAFCHIHFYSNLKNKSPSSETDTGPGPRRRQDYVQDLVDC